MSHADDVIPWGPLPGPVTGKRPRRWWLLLAGLAVIATAASGMTAVTVQVWHFLDGSVPLAYMDPGFGTGGINR